MTVRLGKGDRPAIVQAIQAAEAGRTGEIRVHVEKRAAQPDRALELFHGLGMDSARAAAGVLLYVAESDRTARVVAGPGLPDRDWQAVVDAVAEGYKAGRRRG